MILHIDMDAFYASVEQHDNPALKGKCVIVGGTSQRGVVAAASYEARRYGVHSAMPMFQARQRCPQGVFLRPRMERYQELSDRIMDLLRAYSPQVEPISIDEAYVDISGCERLLGSPLHIAGQIKDRIRQTFALTCSVGIGPNKFIAKIASDLNKPDGLTLIAPHAVASFLETLPIDKAPGIGRVRQQELGQMGIRTLGDVRRYSEEDLVRRLGKFGRRLAALAAGRDDTEVTPDGQRRSVSSEETLMIDTDDKALLTRYLRSQAETVARQLRGAGVRAKTVTLKIKHADFKLVTRSATVQIPTQSSEAIFQAAAGLLKKYPLSSRVRLIGLGASGLVAESLPVQQGLFENAAARPRRWEKVDRALDRITQKYGRQAITRGSLKDE